MRIISESPENAAVRLARQAMREGFELQTLHEYTNKEGELLHWRIRLKNLITNEKWIRPMKFSVDNGYV